MLLFSSSGLLSLREPVLLALPLLNLAKIDPVQILIMLLVMSLSLSVHEAAHAWSAYRLGDDTAALAGRVTLNPLRHLDPVGALMFMFVGIGWAKPVPINPARFDRAKTMRRGIVITSLWGPLSNLILGAIAWFLFCVVFTIMLVARSEAIIGQVFLRLLHTLYVSNMWLFAFNMLPIPPLDGYKVIGALLPSDLYYRIMSVERYIGFVFIFIVMFFRGALVTALSYILTPFHYLIQFPITWLFQQLQQLLGLSAMPQFIFY